VVEMSLLQVAIIFACVLDIAFTYYMVKKSKRQDAELSWLVRLFWRKLGFRAGSIIVSILTFLVMILLVIYLPESMLYFLAGCYAVVMYYHWNILLRLKEEKTMKKICDCCRKKTDDYSEITICRECEEKQRKEYESG